MEALISFEGIAIYCGVLLIAAIFTYVRFFNRIEPLIQELRRGIIEINKSDRDKDAFPAHFYELKEWMDGSKYLKDSWREFEETLLLPGTDYDDDREIILNTRQTNTFFNTRNILWHKINMRFYSAFPNILTGAGILGTFVGLVIGISLAAPGLNSDSMADAKTALELLLNGASLAFITSICGLGSSLLFSWAEKKLVHEFEINCFVLVSDIDARVEYFSAERLANKALQESKKQSFALETFANDLAVSLSDLIAEKVAKPVVDAVNDLTSSQQSASDETLTRLIGEFTESISDAAGEEMKAFASTIDVMTKNLESLINGIHETVTGVVSEMVSATETSTNQIRQVTSEFDAVITKLTSTVDQIGDIETATKDLLEGLNMALSGTNTAIDTTKHIGDQLAATTIKMESTSDNILQSTDKVLDASDQVASLVVKLESMNSDIKSTWEAYGDRFDNIDESVAGLFRNLQDGLSNYSKTTTDYVLGLDKHAAKVVQELASATSELSETVEAISESMIEQRSALQTN